jgi:AcrR family transcriptional regulator
MIQSAALLFRERGVEGTAFADVLEHSGAPRGSVYHHFPGGKLELAEEATQWAGDFMSAGLAAALEHNDPITALDTFAELWTGILEQSDYAAGCPIVAAALEGNRAPAARARAADAFQNWEQLLADAFARNDLDPERARAIATLVIAAFEGAVVLARAQQSTEPLTRVANELRTLASSVLPQYDPD